jgi:hypothetical protein
VACCVQQEAHRDGQTARNAHAACARQRANTSRASFVATSGRPHATDSRQCGTHARTHAFVQPVQPGMRAHSKRAASRTSANGMCALM